MQHKSKEVNFQRAPGHGGTTQHSSTLCPSGLRGWTQVPLAQAAWVQIPQVSFHVDISASQHLPIENETRTVAYETLLAGSFARKNTPGNVMRLQQTNATKLQQKQR